MHMVFKWSAKTMEFGKVTSYWFARCRCVNATVGYLHQVVTDNRKKRKAVRATATPITSRIGHTRMQHAARRPPPTTHVKASHAARRQRLRRQIRHSSSIKSHLWIRNYMLPSKTTQTEMFHSLIHTTYHCHVIYLWDTSHKYVDTDNCRTI